MSASSKIVFASAGILMVWGIALIAVWTPQAMYLPPTGGPRPLTHDVPPQNDWGKMAPRYGDTARMMGLGNDNYTGPTVIGE